MEVLHHEHPLTLIDLNPEYPRDEIVYDDEEELIKKQDFRCPCGRCGQEINFYHRFYYTCDQCDYVLHKLCGELPTTLRHESHRDHILILNQVLGDKWCTCHVCKYKHDYEYLNYRCIECDIYSCLGCSKNDVKNHMIYHPSHPHPIVSISVDISANCRVCRNKHQGNFYQCITCFNFFAHRDCVFLRKRLLIQNFRKDGFFHTHPLTLSYSFPKDDQKAKFDPRCKVCELRFDENLWIYKCEKCRYYVHTDCATTSKKPSLNAIRLNQGSSAVSKNYNDRDHPILLHFPLPDQTNVLNLFHEESGLRAFETNLSDPFHQHPLTLVDTDITPTPTSSRITTTSAHDAMKMVEVVCNACIRPITNLPFYKCKASDDGCNFALHAWCTRLPATITRKNGLETYNYKLIPQPPNILGVFRCYNCDIICNGFAYKKLDTKFNALDVHCALTPRYITHKSHPNHLLGKFKPYSEEYCRLCLSDAKNQICYNCWPCKFSIHSKCALLWPDTVSHKYDKHRLTLRYFPVENYSGDYFCEVCEEEFNPNGAFYHCDKCVQSMHPTCCLPILQKETTYTHFYPDMGVAKFDNIMFGDNVMFGDIYNMKLRLGDHGHPHVVSFCRGVKSDGKCANKYCGMDLEDKLTFKCLECKFAIDLDCGVRYCDYSPKPIVQTELGYKFVIRTNK